MKVYGTLGDESCVQCKETIDEVIRLCLKTRSGFERLIFRLTASPPEADIDDKANIACFAVFAKRKTARSRTRRRSLQKEPRPAPGVIRNNLHQILSPRALKEQAHQPPILPIFLGDVKRLSAEPAKLISKKVTVTIRPLSFFPESHTHTGNRQNRIKAREGHDTV